MRCILAVLVLVAIRPVICDDSLEVESDGAERYEGYKAFWTDGKLNSISHINALTELARMHSNDSFSEIIFDNDVVTASDPVVFLVTPRRVHEIEGFMKRFGIPFSIPERDIRSILDRWEHQSNVAMMERYYRFKEDVGHFGVPNFYMSYKQMEEFLRNTTSGSDIAELYSIGKTYEGRETWAVKVNDDKDDLPAVWVDAGLDPSKWLSQAVANAILYKVLHGPEPYCQYLRENFRWYFAPQVNPDGYEYTWTTDRFWQKTRSPQGDCFGVNLNKNWNSPLWLEGLGSSDDPCSKNFNGPSISSEVETRNLRDAILSVKNRVKAYFSFVSSGQTMTVPGSGPHNIDTGYMANEHFEQMKEVADVGLEQIKNIEADREYEFGTTFDVRYSRAASLLDWMYWDKALDRHTGKISWRNSKDRPNVRYAYAFDLPPSRHDMEHHVRTSNPPASIVPTAYHILQGMHKMLEKITSIPESEQNAKNRDEL